MVQLAVEPRRHVLEEGAHAGMVLIQGACERHLARIAEQGDMGRGCCPGRRCGQVELASRDAKVAQPFASSWIFRSRAECFTFCSSAAERTQQVNVVITGPVTARSVMRLIRCTGPGDRCGRARTSRGRV
jgi:hypothetical protein